MLCQMIDLKTCGDKSFTVWLQWSDNILSASPWVRKICLTAFSSLTSRDKRQHAHIHSQHQHTRYHAFQFTLTHTHTQSCPSRNTASCRHRFVCKVQWSHNRRLVACCTPACWWTPSRSHTCKLKRHAARCCMHDHVSNSRNTGSSVCRAARLENQLLLTDDTRRGEQPPPHYVCVFLIYCMWICCCNTVMQCNASTYESICLSKTERGGGGGLDPVGYVIFVAGRDKHVLCSGS